MADASLAGLDAYRQGKPCPKCSYVRRTSDANPVWQCPSCHIAYLKFQPGAAAPLRARLAAGTREMAQEARHDHSLVALVASNVLALLIAYAAGMRLTELMLVYWLQSMIIGAAHVVRILKLERFDTSNFRINNQPVEETPASKARVAGFFALHYGIFHLGYLAFINVEDPQATQASRGGYLACALVFAVNHAYSLLQNIRRDAQGRPNLGTLMFLPYARVAPMHLTIIFGGTVFVGDVAFAVFGALKIVADVVMHTIEHHFLATGRLLGDPADGDHSQR